VNGGAVDANFIGEVIRQQVDGLFIPEFTYGDLRIDAAVIDVRHRNVRGFEVKVSKEDFIRDKKWQLYSAFCSSLSIVCPEGLIQVEEVSKPFGLVWVFADGRLEYQRMPRNLQSRESLAWTLTYLSVLEKEIARLVPENNGLRLAMQVRETVKA